MFGRLLERGDSRNQETCTDPFPPENRSVTYEHSRYIDPHEARDKLENLLNGKWRKGSVCKRFRGKLVGRVA